VGFVGLGGRSWGWRGTGEGMGDFTVGEDIILSGRDGKVGARVVTVFLRRTESRAGRLMI